MENRQAAPFSPPVLVSVTVRFQCSLFCIKPKKHKEVAAQQVVQNGAGSPFPLFRYSITVPPKKTSETSRQSSHARSSSSSREPSRLSSLSRLSSAF
jgi:hypothetical protein